MSDPHIPTDLTDTSTSNGPGSGKGRCFNWRMPLDTRVADRFDWLKVLSFRSYSSLKYTKGKRHLCAVGLYKPKFSLPSFRSDGILF
jgi:hypothetical protein